MHRIFYFPDSEDPLTAGARALCYSNFHGCFFAQAGDLGRARQHLSMGGDQATVFHLVAEEGIYQGAASAKEARGRCQCFLNALETFISAGGRFVWSVDAELPSWSFAPEQTESLRAGLAALAHLVHCRNFATARALHSGLGLDWRKMIVVPQGGYRPLIDGLDATQASSAREKLGLEIDQCLFTHLGKPHIVSGTDGLLRHWRETKPSRRSLMLMGQLADDLDKGTVAALRQNGIHVETGASSTTSLARKVAFADLVVLPFRQVVGYGELMLALSCGRPVLIPAFPQFLELVTPGREALVYDPEGGDAAFAEALEAALDLDRHQLQTMGARAAARADTLSWRLLGRQLADGFLRVAAGGLQLPLALDPAPPAAKPKLVG